MPTKVPDAIRAQWKERVINQNQSGLSIAAWCRLNNIAPHTFYYWRDKFLPNISINRTDFKELNEQKNATPENRKSGVSLQYQQFCIFLDQHFDAATLTQCLKALEGSLKVKIFTLMKLLSNYGKLKNVNKLTCG